MAGYNLYLKLMSGEVVHVTDAWDGAAPTEEGMVDANGIAVDANGKEVSEPYRNIHNNSTRVGAYNGWYGALDMVGVSVEPKTLVPAGAGGLSASGLAQLTIGDLIVHVSDHIKKVPPRQFAKVYTWLVFEDVETEIAYKWRKSEVIGWSKMPPIDI